MSWLNTFYDPAFSLTLSLVLVAIIAVLAHLSYGRKAMIGLCLFLYARYMIWRGLYTLNTDDATTMAVSVVLLGAEIYGLIQFVFFAYQSWDPTDRPVPPLLRKPSVDIFIPIVNEPLSILRRTVVGCLSQDYPHERITVYVLDDGHRDEVKQLAESLGCRYIRRSDRTHAKAGNLNHALERSQGELVAVFDVDHVPVRSFLKSTVGFFTEERIAFVQTPQHFYNPDIFQRNLKIESHVINEQELFFRVLQAGRDRHNSAFFAGSSGIFQRAALQSIGGFQTQTITEDLHTSLLLHAKGYQSRYLNKVLSAGLMPETFAGYIKQRKRWAVGSCQMLLRDNPLFMRGLTVPQRIDYLGSIFYFFFGLPRIICLLAPLSWLFLSIPAVKADTWMLLSMFFSYFMAATLATKVVMKGTRSLFWSDVYETAMCASLTGSVLKAFWRPWKSRPFEVTPKGQRVEKQGFEQGGLVGFHLVTFGLLIVGLGFGVQQWMGTSPVQGLGMCLFWGSINLLLITLALFSASEQPQVRRELRLSRQFSCQLQTDTAVVDGYTVNLHEEGMAVIVPKPVLTQEKLVTLCIKTNQGMNLNIRSAIVRQERLESGSVEVGLQFVDMDDAQTDALLQTVFSPTGSWKAKGPSPTGFFKGLAIFLAPLVTKHESLQIRRRQTLRLQRQIPCWLDLAGQRCQGVTDDISFSGFSVTLKGRHVEVPGLHMVHLPEFILKALPISWEQGVATTSVHFKVESIEKGEQEWLRLHQQFSSHSS